MKLKDRVAIISGGGRNIGRAIAYRLHELGCAVIGRDRMRPDVNEAVTVVRLMKRGDIPAKYPRRPGVPGKRPL